GRVGGGGARGVLGWARRGGDSARGYAEGGGRPARSEVHADDRRVHERVDQEEVAVRSRDSRPGIPPGAVGLRRVVNPDLVVAEVDDQFDRTARQNPLPGMRWGVRTKPEAVDVLVERGTGGVGAQEHGRGPQEPGNAAEGLAKLSGPLAGDCTTKDRHAAPVCCSGGFGKTVAGYECWRA